jgi:outer membrane protein assembly factor BamB
MISIINNENIEIFQIWNGEKYINLLKSQTPGFGFSFNKLVFIYNDLPSGTSNKEVLMNPEHNIFCMDALSGKIIWSYKDADVTDIGADEKFFVMSKSPWFYKVNPDTGEQFGLHLTSSNKP